MTTKQDRVPVLRIDSQTLEYVRVAVKATDNGEDVDLGLYPIQMAFPAKNVKPAAEDWKGGSWEVETISGKAQFFARCLVGPGGAATLTPGDWDIWVKFTGPTEIPVRHVGVLRVE